jgi:nucleotide-binding universal stress UspA family protein
VPAKTVRRSPALHSTLGGEQAVQKLRERRGSVLEMDPCMKILCGDDFSEAAAQAVNAAAALARDTGHSLELVHVLDFPFSADAASREHLLESTRRALESRAAAVGATARVMLETVERGLMQAAQEAAVELVVVGASGAGKRRGAGSRADALVRHARVPVLVVRDVEPFRGWQRDERRLSVLMGLERDGSGASAWRFAQTLFGRQRTNWSGAHFYFPPDEQGRIGLEGVQSAIDPDAKVEHVLRRDLLAHYPGLGESVHLEPLMGRASESLVEFARVKKADVIVVGSHRRSAIERLWFGSVSRHVLHDAPCSVLCVPRSSTDKRVGENSERNALVTVDLTWLSRTVVDRSCASLPADFTLQLLHVVPPTHHLGALEGRDVFGYSHPKTEERIRRLLPAGTQRRVEVVVAESHDPARAILQAAERFGVSVIVLGLPSPIISTTVRDVLSATHHPTLLVPGPER